MEQKFIHGIAKEEKQRGIVLLLGRYWIPGHRKTGIYIIYERNIPYGISIQIIYSFIRCSRST